MKGRWFINFTTVYANRGNPHRLHGILAGLKTRVCQITIYHGHWSTNNSTRIFSVQRVNNFEAMFITKTMGNTADNDVSEWMMFIR